MTVEQHEQFHQCERGLGLAVLIAGERIRTAAEDRRRLPVVEREFLANPRDKGMPGYKPTLSDEQLWQVSQFVLNRTKPRRGQRS